MRWWLVLVFWLAGGLWLAYGVLVEIQVRAEVGSGLYKGLAYLLYRSDIEEYRWLSRCGAVGGPILIALGFLCRRRVAGLARDPQKASQQLDKRASGLLTQFHVSSAEQLPPRAKKHYDKLLRKSQQLKNMHEDQH